MTGFGAIPFVSASIIAPVPTLIADQGGKVDRPFRAAAVPVEIASDPELILTTDAYLSLLECAAHETGDEHFGVSLGQTFSVGEDLGPFGALISGARTLRQAIEVVNALIRYFSSASNCWLEVDGQRARWAYQIKVAHNHNEGRRHDCEGSLMMFRTVIRMAAGPNWQASEILLGPTAPHQARALASRFGTPTRCGDAYALVFPRDLLDFPMSYGKPVSAADRRALVHRLISSAPEQTFIGSVKAVIRSQLCGGNTEMSAVARATELSVRTFQRRLAEEGCNYKELVADVRRGLAHELLADPSRSQLDVSLSLGYSDAANFSRAFRHWTGTAPRDFRRTLDLSKPSA